MKNINPDFLERSREVFVSVASMTLQGLRDKVAAEAKSTGKRDILSALDTLSRAFGRPLSQVRATPASVRDLLAGKSAVEVGLSPKRLANVRSDVAKALRLYGETVKAITKRIPLTPAWGALLGSIATKHHRMALARLASFCSAMEVAPGEVNGTTLLGFYGALEAEEVVKNPRKLLKMTIAIWNMCGRRVPEWPPIKLGSPFKTDPYTLPLAVFPEAFQNDVAAWVKRVKNPDPLDGIAGDAEISALSRPMRKATIDGYVVIIRRFASALVHRKCLRIEEITGLAVFFELERFNSGLRFFLDRFKQKTPDKTGRTPAVLQLANCLRHIAKYHCKVDEQALKQLTSVCKAVDPKIPRQLSARNRERLQQFDNPDNVVKLFAFPNEERARGLKQSNPIRAAKCMERALAVDLLIHCVPRMQNLHTIHLTKNLRFVGDKCFLSFEAEEVKNSRLLNFELTDDVAASVKTFIEVYRLLLAHPDSPFLFCGNTAGPKSHNALREGIEHALRTKSGLYMHPHLFRHAIAKIVVERNPELYAAVSQLLGHARLDMTLAHYLGTESRAAAKHIDALLAAVKKNPKGKKD